MKMPVNMNTTLYRIYADYSFSCVMVLIFSAVLWLCWQFVENKQKEIVQIRSEAKIFASASLHQCAAEGLRRTDNECINATMQAARNLRGDDFAGVVSEEITQRLRENGFILGKSN